MTMIVRVAGSGTGGRAGGAAGREAQRRADAPEDDAGRSLPELRLAVGILAADPAVPGGTATEGGAEAGVPGRQGAEAARIARVARNFNTRGAGVRVRDADTGIVRHASALVLLALLRFLALTEARATFTVLPGTLLTDVDAAECVLLRLLLAFVLGSGVEDAKPTG